MREDVKWTFCCSNAFLCFQAIVNKMADNEVLQEEAKSVKSNTVTVLVENETPVIVSEEANGSDGKSCSSSIAWSSTPSLNQRSTEKFRSLKRRSSVENFGQFGFLVPALSLVPQADGVDLNFNRLFG